MGEQQMGIAAWVTIASAFAACAAAGFAYWSARTSHHALQLAKQQECRRRPALLLYLVDGYVWRHPSLDDRSYAFLISISNPTDSDNAIARLDLRFSYRTSANLCAAVDVPAVTTAEPLFGGPDQVKLRVPVRVDAHQTITGWAHFNVKNALFHNCKIDGHTILVTDTQGEQTTIDTTLVREFVHEAETELD